MASKNTIIAAVVVVVIIVVAVAAYALVNNGDDEEETAQDTYYFYMDGFGPDSGWYTAESDNIVDAYIAAMAESELVVTVSSGWVSVEGFEGTSDQDEYGNWYGTGIAIYSYISTDVSNYNATYFALGGSLDAVASNIVYISWGEYVMDGTTWETTYYTNPVGNDEIALGGPFTDESYQPLDYSGTFYFYMDGFGPDSGWYTAESDNIVDAFIAAMAESELVVTVSSGWVSVEGFEGTSDQDEYGNWYGTGIAIYSYVSTDVSNYNATYFALGGSLDTVASNIVYISWGEYVMDGTTWETTYYTNPVGNDEIALGGPFA